MRSAVTSKLSAQVPCSAAVPCRTPSCGVSAVRRWTALDWGLWTWPLPLRGDGTCTAEFTTLWESIATAWPSSGVGMGSGALMGAAEACRMLVSRVVGDDAGTVGGMSVRERAAATGVMARAAEGRGQREPLLGEDTSSSSVLYLTADDKHIVFLLSRKITTRTLETAHVQRERLFVAPREASHHEVIPCLLQQHAGGVLGHARAQYLAHRKHVDKLHRDRHKAVLPIAERPLHEALVNQLVQRASDESGVVGGAAPQVVDEGFQKGARVRPCILRRIHTCVGC